MSKIVSYLNPRYHEIFGSVSLIHSLTNRESFHCENRPGFWFTVDENGNMIRCGCTDNIYTKLSSFISIPIEKFIRFCTSYFSGEIGLKNMKEYKQKFKKVYNMMQSKEYKQTKEYKRKVCKDFRDGMEIHEIIGSCYNI